jgi:hypothetical protein
MVGVTLRFLIEQVGQVEGVYLSEGRLAEGGLAESGLAENFILRRTASHGLELLGFVAFRASPIWVLAALADVTGGSHRLMHEITDALKEEGLLDAEGGFETMEQVLSGLEKTSAHLALTLNMPPVNVTELRREWETLKTDLQSIPPSRIPGLDRIERTWDELRTTARTQNRTVFKVSSLLAISTLAHVPANVLWLSRATRSAARRTSVVVGGAILDHYSEALKEIGNVGFGRYWQREFRPYLRAAAQHFSPDHSSFTERILRKSPGASR